MRPDFFMEKNIRILEKIGEGAFGQVYKGLYKNEEVAIKFLQGAQIQETSIMENLQHKNIINFFQFVSFYMVQVFQTRELLIFGDGICSWRFIERFDETKFR
ncbi:unnamed protein product [Paramecium octaurelia]|uniref:Protein kinase domain-containing protein n=1 Tax=Paramecium octaurelia TaxID=43137 RepID=A0A8S1U875_PAROT|nr:unnamed protein product [Paramecium octaurelia]